MANREQKVKGEETGYNEGGWVGRREAAGDGGDGGGSGGGGVET